MCVWGVKLSRHPIWTTTVFIFIWILRLVDHCTGDPAGIWFQSFPVKKICVNFITNRVKGARKGLLISASVSLIASGITEGNINDIWSATCIKLQWKDAAPHAILLYCYLPLQSPGTSLWASCWGWGVWCYRCDCLLTFDRFLCASLYSATLHTALCHSSIATAIRRNHSARLEYQDANH